MFIGERNNKSNVTLDDSEISKISENISKAIVLPNYDTSEIAKLLSDSITLPNVNVVLDSASIASKVNNPINQNTNACRDTLRDNQIKILTSISENASNLGLYEFQDDRMNIGSLSIYHMLKANYNKSPNILHIEYTTWTLEVTRNGKSIIMDYIPIKVIMFEHFMRIKILKTIKIRNGDVAINNPNLYLDDNHLLKPLQCLNPDNNKVIDYYKKFIEKYPYTGGSDSVGFPLNIVDASNNNSDVGSFFVVVTDRDSKGNIKPNLHVMQDGLDANSYQYILPTTIDTLYMDTGITYI